MTGARESPAKKRSLSEEDFAELFDRFVDELLDGDEVDVSSVIAAHPEAGSRIGELYDLAHRVSARASTSTPRLEGYEILRELGHGGMGRVYLARNEQLGRQVALKVLPPSLGLSDHPRRRFLSEARALAQVTDEHIVRIYDVVERPDLLAYEMEWVDGPSLRDLIVEKNAGSLQYLVRLGIDIARALEKVHGAGLVHRDVKPANILIRRDGTPLLADFGLARSTDSSVTQSGVFVGTPVYAPPEQLRAGPEGVDARADVYSLGVTLHEAIGLAMPFRGRSTGEVLRKIETGDAPRLRRIAPGVPKDLETILRKAMEPRREDRYPSAAALADDLERLLNLEPIHAKPAGLWKRGGKLLRRHRTVVVTAMIGTLVGALGITPFVFASQREAQRQQEVASLVRQARLQLLSAGRESAAFDQIVLGRGGGDPLNAATWPGLGQAEKLYERAFALDPARHDLALELALVRFVLDGLNQRPVPEALRAAGGILARATDREVDTTGLLRLDPDAIESAPEDQRRPLGLLAFLHGDATTCERSWKGISDEGFEILDAALGTVYLADGRPGLAYAHLERAYARFPEVAHLRIQLADAALRVGDPDRARSLLSEVESTGMSSALQRDLRRVKADLLVASGDVAGARREYADLAASQLRTGVPQFRLAQLDARAGDIEGARERLARLVARFPRAARYRRALAVAALQSGATTLYLEQVLHVLGADFGVGRSPGTVRDLLDILHLSGLEGLVARGREATGFWAPITRPGGLSRFPTAVRGRSSLGEVEALLWRVAAFQKDAAEVFTLPSDVESEQVRQLAKPIGTAAGLLIHFPEVLTMINPPERILLRAAALWCRERWSSLTRRGLHAVVAALGLFGVAAAQHAQHHLYTFRGEVTGDMFGYWWAVSVLPDLDKDGHAEVVVGAPQELKKPAGPGYAKVFSGRDGRVLFTFTGKTIGDGFGNTVASAGDVDLDSYPDVIVGATGGNYAKVFSGRTGKEIRSWSSSAKGLFGWNVDGVGDIDRDGWGDVLVSAIFESCSGATNCGSVRVYSGKTSKELAVFRGANNEALGAGASAAGDVNKDGYPDILVAAPASAQNGYLSGRVHVYSGLWIAKRQGKQALHTWHGGTRDRIGQRVANAGDVDGDGYPDAIVGANNANGTIGYARVFSGKTGKVIWTFHGSSSGDWFGSTVSGAGDVDKDGRADLLAGAGTGGSTTRGYVRLFSGKTGKLLRQFDGKAKYDALVSVAGGRDVNADGYPDMILGAIQAEDGRPPTPKGPGYVKVFSGRELSIATDAHAVSLSNGGVQNYSLSAGNAHAGKTCVLYGALSGTIPAGPLPLPIDPYFPWSLMLIDPSVGTLDGDGNATAKMIVPPGLPASWAGETLWHAYVVVDLSLGFPFVFAGRPAAPMLFVK